MILIIIIIYQEKKLGPFFSSAPPFYQCLVKGHILIAVFKVFKVPLTGLKN